jgi:hypothetical protein
MKAPKSNAKRELINEGIYPAILYSMVQIGTVEGYQGKMQNKLRVTFELPDETREFDGVAKPLVIGKEMTFSMAPKAGLRKIAEAITGKSMTDDVADDFEIDTLVGKACIVNIKSKEGENGTYNYIDSFTPLMKGQKVKGVFNPLVTLFYASWNEKVFETLPKFMQEKVKTSVEYKEMKGLILPTEDMPEGEIEVDADSMPF